MKIRLASDLQLDSVVDGTGIRTVLWTQGCGHNCPGCHNPQTHDFNGGFEEEVEEIVEEIGYLEAQTGVTFSGGDPFYQQEACAIIAKSVHENNMDVWCYTGVIDFLKQIDVLVDGKFIMARHSYSLKFRGSSNQRIIDVKKSLEQNAVVLHNFDEAEEQTSYGRYHEAGLYV